MAAKAVKKETLDFERELTRLEAIADRLEEGDLPLDELLKGYEEGMLLSKTLQQQLERARARMLEVREGKDGKPECKSKALEEAQASPEEDME